MNTRPSLDRREFLKVSALSGVGLIISVYLSGCEEPPTPLPQPTVAASGTPPPTSTPQSTPESPAWLEPSVYLKIGNDGLITVTVHRSEMGQGVRTALPMIVAEELGADWTTIRVEQAPGESIYGDQQTGGSQSIRDTYLPLRRAGAVARELLVTAAAQTWGVDKSNCYSENSTVVNRASGEQLPFGALVTLAGTLPVPRSSEVTLKDPKDFRLIGTRVHRVDDLQIVTGRAIYGMDVKLPAMLYATVARCPVVGGSVQEYADSKARKVAGVRDVVKIASGIAVVAEHTWGALRGRQALEIVWNEGQGADLNSVQMEQELQTQAEKAKAQPDELIAYYVIPFFSHAPMEPMNCTADVRADRCEVWAPTQNPQAVKQSVISLTRLPEEAVVVHVPLAGGAFGRRLESGLMGAPPPSVDYVSEAVQISQAVGAPVHLIWTREDDIHHDMFHPSSVTRVSAKLNDISTLTMKRSQVSGLTPTGYWRSVTNVPEAFAHESFLDEFAAATGQDALELRRQLLSGRARAVLELAAEKANWGTPLPAGYGRGIAYHATWDVTHVAQVAEVSVEEGRVRVQRVVCAVDCGTVINPDIVEAQMEGGIVFGLTATLKEAITIEGGRVKQSNFHDYPLLRLDETPTIEVYIVPSTERPTGVGEMANPPIAAAVANAVFAASGKRIRRLPIRAEDLR